MIFKFTQVQSKSEACSEILNAGTVNLVKIIEMSGEVGLKGGWMERKGFLWTWSGSPISDFHVRDYQQGDPCLPWQQCIATHWRGNSKLSCISLKATLSILMVLCGKVLKTLTLYRQAKNRVLLHTFQGSGFTSRWRCKKWMTWVWKALKETWQKAMLGLWKPIHSDFHVNPLVALHPILNLTSQSWHQFADIFRTFSSLAVRCGFMAWNSNLVFQQRACFAPIVFFLILPCSVCRELSPKESVTKTYDTKSISFLFLSWAKFAFANLSSLHKEPAMHISSQSLCLSELILALQCVLEEKTSTALIWENQYLAIFPVLELYCWVCGN